MTELERESERVSDPALGLAVVAEPEVVILLDGRLGDRLNELDLVAVALSLTLPVPVGGVADTVQETEVADGLAVRKLRLPVSVRLRDGLCVGDLVRDTVRVANAEHELLPDWVVADKDAEDVRVVDGVGDGLEGVGEGEVVSVEEAVNEMVADTVSEGEGETEQDAEAVDVAPRLKLRVAVCDLGVSEQLRDAVGGDDERVPLVV